MFKIQAIDLGTLKNYREKNKHQYEIQIKIIVSTIYYY